MNKIDYNSQQFKWAKEIMKEKAITILDINWNKFKTKKEIEEFIDMLEKPIKKVIKDNKEVELTRKIIMTYLNSIDNTNAIKEAILISLGDHDDILLEHIKALLNIFEIAKQELEKEQNQ